MSAALGHRHHTNLRKRRPINAGRRTGAARATEPLHVLRRVRRIEGGAVDSQHPPAPIPRTTTRRGRQRLGDLLEQHLQRRRAQPDPRPRDRRRRGHPPRLRPPRRPRQPLGQQPGHLFITLTGEQAHRQHEIHHHPRRQQPITLPLPTGLGDHPIHQLRRKRPGQQPDRDPIRQPRICLGLHLPRPRRPHTSRTPNLPDQTLSHWYWL